MQSKFVKLSQRPKRCRAEPKKAERFLNEVSGYRPQKRLIMILPCWRKEGAQPSYRMPSPAEMMERTASITIGTQAPQRCDGRNRVTDE